MTVPDLPTVTYVEALPGRAARLTLDSGQTVLLSPERTPHLLFLPLTAQGVPVVREDGRSEDAPAYYVPAPLADTVSAALRLEPVSRALAAAPQVRGKRPPELVRFRVSANGKKLLLYTRQSGRSLRRRIDLTREGAGLWTINPAAGHAVFLRCKPEARPGTPERWGVVVGCSPEMAEQLARAFFGRPLRNPQP